MCKERKKLRRLKRWALWKRNHFQVHSIVDLVWSRTKTQVAKYCSPIPEVKSELRRSETRLRWVFCSHHLPRHGGRRGQYSLSWNGEWLNMAQLSRWRWPTWWESLVTRPVTARVKFVQIPTINPNYFYHIIFICTFGPVGLDTAMNTCCTLLEAIADPSTVERKVRCG